MTPNAVPLFIQLGFDLPEPDAPSYRFSEFIAEHFESAPEVDKPWINLAAELLDATADDLRQGLKLIRAAFDSGRPLTYRDDGLKLNYFLHAIDWLNEASDGGVELPETAAQLGLTPRTIRAFIAEAYVLDTRGAQRFLVLPATFHAVIEQFEPRAKLTTPAPVPAPAPRAPVTPKFHAQPALSAVAHKWVKARRKDPGYFNEVEAIHAAATPSFSWGAP